MTPLMPYNGSVQLQANPMLLSTAMLMTSLQCRNNSDTLGIDPNRVIVGGSSSGGNIVRASVAAFKSKQLLLTYLPQAAALALKDRDEGIGSVFGQVLNIPDTCHPGNFPKD